MSAERPPGASRRGGTSRAASGPATRLLRSRSLIFDLYGPFIRPLGNWMSVADLITLMRAVGIEEQAVRSSISRFLRRDLLEREVRRGQIGYGLTEHALHILEEGDVRIFSRLEPAEVEDGWALARFSVPESVRADRHQLRSRLTWLGFGNLGSGLWIAPGRVLQRTIQMVSDLGLQRHVDVFVAHYKAFGSLEDLAARCWDIPRMRTFYRQYVRDFEPCLKRWRRRDPFSDPERAFADYILAIHEWRKMPYVDPGLPLELLPADCEGLKARSVFGRVRECLEDAARAYVNAVIAGSPERVEAPPSARPSGPR